MESNVNENEFRSLQGALGDIKGELGELKGQIKALNKAIETSTAATNGRIDHQQIELDDLYKRDEKIKDDQIQMLQNQASMKEAIGQLKEKNEHWQENHKLHFENFSIAKDVIDKVENKLEEKINSNSNEIITIKTETKTIKEQSNRNIAIIGVAITVIVAIIEFWPKG